jgi:hypothetical protein
MFIDKKILTIAALSLTAGLLLLANFAQKPARADLVNADRDYQLITARAANGGDTLYVMDNRIRRQRPQPSPARGHFRS